MFLTELSLKRPVLATVSILALVALGVIAYLTLSISDWPEMEFSYVTVTIVQPGASPEQMETGVAQELEEAMTQISGVKHVFTTAREGVVIVWAEFALEKEPQEAVQDVRDKLGLIRSDLPEGIEEPIITRYDPTVSPIITLAVSGEQSLKDISELVDEKVKRRLETISGVGAVNILGRQKREIQILLDLNKMKAFNLSVVEVVGSLRNQNLEIPGGSLKSKENKINLRITDKLIRVDDFEQLPVAKRGGSQLYVKDIATVVDGIKERQELVRYQGQPAVGLEIIKQSGNNTVKVADRVRKEISALQKELPPGVKLEVVRDNSVGIRNMVRDVSRTLFEGGILAVLIIFIFLRNPRSTLISAISIPTSIIVSFTIMKVMGFSLNTMTLMALSLSIGLLIDDAIVVVENINRHLEMGKTPVLAVRDASKEIGLAVMATTFTVVAVFLPVGMMTGEIGQFFKQFGITVAFSVLVSLLVAFTLVPLLAAHFLDMENKGIGSRLGRVLERFNRGFEELAQNYVKFLRLALQHRWQTISIAIILFVGSLTLVPLLGSGFVPSADLGEVNVIAELDSGVNLEKARRTAGEIEKLLRSYREVERVYSTINTDQIHIFVKVVDKGQREKDIREIAADMRRKLSQMPGVRTSMAFFQAGMLEEKDWEFRVQGEDREKLQIYAEQAQRILESIPGVVDVSSSYKPGKPEIKIKVDEVAAADLGVSTGQIADVINTLFTGTVLGQYQQANKRIDVRLRLSEEQREDVTDLEQIYLPGSFDAARGAQGPLLTLSQVAQTQFSTSPSELNRSDRYKDIILSGNLDGITLGELNNIFLKKVEKEIKLPKGYRMYAGGDSERMEDTFSSMIMALITGILFIFFILAAQFESYIDPLSIMLSLPMAIIGAILGLLITGSDLNLVSMIGIIMLMGLVSKNAILLIDFAKRSRAEGLERDEALLQAAGIRLRPILMTTTAMIFAMIPLALSLGAGSEQRASMAHAIIGGLITSTLLTLIVVPVTYTLFDDLKNRLTRFRKPRTAKIDESY